MTQANRKSTKLTPEAKRAVLAWLGPRTVSDLLAGGHKVKPEALSLAYAICKDEKLLDELFAKADAKLRQGKTERMRHSQAALLQSLRPLLANAVAVVETNDGEGFVCDPEVEVCEDPDAGNHGGEDGGKGKGDPGFDWGGLVVLVVSGLLLLASG